MPRPGWIKLYHILLDNPMWLEKPFDESHAWVDLLLLAAHETHDAGGETWIAGQVKLSKEWLMKRWGWTRWRIDNVLKRWESDGMIQRTIQRTNQRTSYTVITIEKWAFYQGGKGKNQRTDQRTNQPQHKKYIKTGGGGGPTPRLADDVEVVKINGKWVARVK